MYPNHNSCPTTQQLADTVALPKQKAEVQHKMHDPRGKFDAALELQVLCGSVQVVVFSAQFSVCCSVYVAGKLQDTLFLRRALGALGLLHIPFRSFNLHSP